MKILRVIPKKTMENNLGTDKVQVITAGGAASIAGKKKKRKTRRRNNASKTAPTQESFTGIESAKASSEVVVSSPPASTSEVTFDLQNSEPASSPLALELEQSDSAEDALLLEEAESLKSTTQGDTSLLDQPDEPVKLDTMMEDSISNSKTSELFWLFLCFIGIMMSFVVYGILLEYTTSGGRKLHELSFLFVTSSLYTVTAAAGRYVRAETPTTIPPARFAILGLTSMGSTFCSVRSLR